MENIDAHTETPNAAATAGNAATATTDVAASTMQNAMAGSSVSAAEAARAKKLSALNTSFYAEVAASFSETRQTKWPGWDILADYLENANETERIAATECAAGNASKLARERAAAKGHAAERPGRQASESPAFSVLDVACGNMRFEKYLQARFPNWRLSFDAIDNCLPLAEDARQGSIDFYERDVIGLLADGSLALPPETARCGCARRRAGNTGPADIDSPAGASQPHAGGSPAPLPRTACDKPGYNLSVCFGFFHHIPLFEMRVSLLRQLIGALAMGGTCCVSLWRFLDDARIAEKAQSSTERARSLGIVEPADLHAGDYLLGWKERDDVFRYCHHFDDAEISSLVKSVADIADLALEYRADGKTGSLNTYLVFTKRERDAKPPAAGAHTAKASFANAVRRKQRE